MREFYRGRVGERRGGLTLGSSHFPVVWPRRSSISSHRSIGKKACSVTKRWTVSFPFYRTCGGSRAWCCSLDLRTQVKSVIVSHSHDHTAEKGLLGAHSQPAPSGYFPSRPDMVPPGTVTLTLGHQKSDLLPA